MPCPQRTVSAALLALAAGGSLALAQPAADPAAKPAAPAAHVPIGKIHFTTETVVENVEVPWAIVFTPAPDSRMFFTERPGRVRVYQNGKLQEQPYFTVPNVLVKSETGLMGMCLHPDYLKNKLVYLAYGYSEGTTRDVRVVRYKDTGTTLEMDKVIISGAPVSGNHSGCRIHFGPDGKLYISHGEMFKRELAQDMNSLGGKILRVNDDGTAPADNPFVGKDGARPEIWAFGVRNPQGFDWQPGTGLMFETEHGPSGEPGIGTDGDEFNQIEKGKNYGGPTIHHSLKQDGLESPLVDWTPGVAPASGMFYTSDAIPGLKGDFLVGCLRGSKIIRITLDGNKVAGQDVLVKGLGRIREIAQGPDGAIYFATSNKDGRGKGDPKDDRIMRLVPQK